MNEPIDSRQLQVFLCLANKGSLKAAAAELFLTSSAISHSITNLETSLGVQLFHRSGKGLVLTEKGEFLYRKAIPVVAQMNNIRGSLAEADLAERSSLRVASGFNFVSYIVPDVVREFNECFPRGNLSIRVAERDACLKLLQSREINAAILVDPPNDGDDFSYTRLFDDELKVVINARNPLAGLDVIPLRNLIDKPLIVSRAQSYTVSTTLERIRRKGFEFRECVEVGSTATIYEMVKLGLGVALLPEWIIQREMSAPLVVSRPIEGLRIRRTWAFVIARWTIPNLASRTFKRLCQQATADLGNLAQPTPAALAS